MNFFLKNAICFLAILISEQSTVHASRQCEDFLKKTPTYKLNQLHEQKLDLDKMRREIGYLKKKGFPEKRAMEIYAQEKIGKVFAKKFKVELLSAEKILKKIGGTCTVEFNKTNLGVMDDIFTTHDINWLKKGHAPVVYNQTHFIQDSQPVEPVDLKNLKNSYHYTLPRPDMWSGSVNAQITRPCGKVKASLPISWSLKVLGLQNALTSRLEQARIGHTITLLKSDGTLTLFDVVKS